MKDRERIGCIADDFTGAADVCSFLLREGASCVLINDIPEKIPEVDADVVVIALKIRTIKKENAINKVEQAIDVLEKMGVSKIFDKYCSTFDSTSDGNIGPILDYLIERYDQQYSIISPSLPENNREVFNGYLFADKVLLSESSMKNHPLTPMHDSNLIRLMDKQSKYKSYSLNYRTIESNREESVDFLKSIEGNDRYYLVTDYFKKEHGKKIMNLFGDLKVLSGSSVFISDWYKYLFKDKKQHKKISYKQDTSKAVIFSGSLSDKTTNQVKEFIDNGGLAIEIKAKNIDKENINKYKEILINNDENVLFYSTRDKYNNKKELKKNAQLLEKFFADMSIYAYRNGINKIIVAGGETSGAVIKALPFSSYIATKLVAPGVPVLRSIENQKFQIVLKSGNFGQDNFFDRTIKIMEN